MTTPQILFTLAYIACCVWAWFVFCDVYRKYGDVTIGEGAFVGFLSLFGPCALIVAGGFWLIDREPRHNRKPKIIWERKE